MNVLVILVPVSLLMACAALAVFVWTLRAKQYDDLEGDAWRILLDDDVIDGAGANATETAPDTRS